MLCMRDIPMKAQFNRRILGELTIPLKFLILVVLINPSK